VGIGLDQPTVGGTANNAKKQITRVHGQGARLEVMSLQPAFALDGTASPRKGYGSRGVDS
jgi:hypothetical protein